MMTDTPVNQELNAPPELDDLQKFFSEATAMTAARTALYVDGLFLRGYKPGEPDQFKQAKRDIDGIAARTLTGILNKARCRIYSAGSEGRKEKKEDGQAAPSIDDGWNGSSEDVEVAIVSDVVELTSRCARGEDGPTTCIAYAVASPGDNVESLLASTPPDSDYMVKFAGPAALNGAGINLEDDHAANLEKVLAKLGIKPEELTQVMLSPYDSEGHIIEKRRYNIRFLEAAEKLGVKVILVDSGDLLPALAAMEGSAKNTIVVGRGGFEEGVILAAAAKAVGGFLDACYWDAEKQTHSEKILLDELVGAKPEQISVDIAFIRYNEWFKKSGVRMEDGRMIVTTMHIDKTRKFVFHEHVFNQEEIKLLGE